MGEHGKRFQPHLLRAARNAETGQTTVIKPRPLPAVKLHDPRHWATIIGDMRQVISSVHGTAHRIDGAGYTIAGKTGTAQVYSLGADQTYHAGQVPRALQDHALFIAFAPALRPRIAVAVIVEHGGGHHALAVPLARAVLDAYMHHVAKPKHMRSAHSRADSQHAVARRMLKERGEDNQPTTARSRV